MNLFKIITYEFIFINKKTFILKILTYQTYF